jgi:hypothetical protein
MKPTMLLPILALMAVACAPKPAANVAAAGDGINAAADCASVGPTNSPAYNDCVQALTNPNAAGAPNVNAAQMRAQIQQQMAQQQAQMQAQMNAMQAGGNSAGCVTTRDANNNVVTQCP